MALAAMGERRCWKLVRLTRFEWTVITGRARRQLVPRRTCDTCFASSLAKSAGFHRAPRASIRPSAPVWSTTLFASSSEKMSPLSNRGKEEGSAARSSVMASHCAQCLGRSGTRRQCTASASTPHDSITRASCSVSAGESRMRILHVTGRRPPKFRTRVVRMSRTRSGSWSSAEPIPPCVENLTGQPMFTSIARTSSATTLAAASASGPEAVPSWNASLSCGTVEKMSLPSAWRYSASPRADTERRQAETDLSTSSSE
eukprot:scaffold107_cov106-Isochrysis_galbana.AAC.5